jgi:hypothetical protein
MTKQLSRIVWPALALAAMAMAPLTAEAADIRARVPFDFTVKGRALPSGTYTVSEERGVLTLTGERTGAIVLTTRVSENKRQPRLVFERYGEQYVLRQVWTSTAGNQVPRSRHDLDLAQKARNGQIAEAERVEIPAL